MSITTVTRTIKTPTPLSDPSIKTFLLKVAARCNIDCDYCYEYRLADQSWRTKPRRMSKETLTQAVDRIKEHVLSHDLQAISVIFHGGEPLLAGQEFLEFAVSLANETLAPLCKVKYGMQTNGVLLDQTWAALLKRLKIGVGISIDGYKELNDKHRLDFRGRSTFESVVAAIRLLSQPEYADIRGGLLCVIQPASNPITLLDWFRQFGQMPVDFLFPHYNHQVTPPLEYDQTHGFGYGLWLSRLFDYWWDNDFHEIKIRVFEDLMHLMIGGKYAVESFGLSPVRLAVVQTDGEYEAVDSLKSTFEGAVSTSKNVFTDPFDGIFSKHLISSRMSRFENLSAECQNCRFVKACGGGYIPHRYHPTRGFNAPSIYCQDLFFLMAHIEQRLLPVVDGAIKERLVETICPSSDVFS